MKCGFFSFRNGLDSEILVNSVGMGFSYLTLGFFLHGV
jgi:hypothetical protein